MPYMGTIRDDTQGMVEITADGAGTMSIEVTFLNQRGTEARRMLAESIPAAATRQYTLPIQRIHPSRMMVEVAIPVGGSGTFRFVQGALSFIDDFVGDVRYVFDAFPGP